MAVSLCLTVLCDIHTDVPLIISMLRGLPRLSCPQSMCFQLRDALRVGCIGLYRGFFSNSMDPREVLKMLDDELRNFCILVDPAKTPFGKVKKTYSGKVGGRNDDIVIAFQLAITGARCFYQSEKYVTFRPVRY